MSEISKQRLIDGDKLLEWLRDELGGIEGLWNKGFDSAINEVTATIKLGRFDIPSDQGEAARLREALEKIRTVAKKCSVEIYLISDFALSSHTEDTGGGACCDLSKLTSFTKPEVSYDPT